MEIKVTAKNKKDVTIAKELEKIANWIWKEWQERMLKKYFHNLKQPDKETHKR